MKTITFVGNIGSVDALKDIGQHTVLNFSVAVNGRDKQAPPEWIRCALWDRRAQALAPHLAKGKKVCVIGEHSIRKYEKDGRDCFSEECRVSEMEFFDVAKREGGGQQGGGYSGGQSGGSSSGRGGGQQGGGYGSGGGGGGYSEEDYGDQGGESGGQGLPF